MKGNIHDKKIHVLCRQYIVPKNPIPSNMLSDDMFKLAKAARVWKPPLVAVARANRMY